MSKEEFESKYKPGDIIVIEDRIVIIYAGLREMVDDGDVLYDILFHAILFYPTKFVVVNVSRPNGGMAIINRCEYGSIRLATNYEKEDIYEGIRKDKLKWNPVTFTFENID